MRNHPQQDVVVLEEVRAGETVDYRGVHVAPVNHQDSRTRDPRVRVNAPGRTSVTRVRASPARVQPVHGRLWARTTRWCENCVALRVDSHHPRPTDRLVTVRRPRTSLDRTRSVFVHRPVVALRARVVRQHLRRIVKMDLTIGVFGRSDRVEATYPRVHIHDGGVSHFHTLGTLRVHYLGCSIGRILFQQSNQ